MIFWLKKPEKRSKMAKFWFFSHKNLNFYVTCLKFCTGTPFSITHERKKRVDPVLNQFGQNGQKFKKAFFKNLQKSQNMAISWKKFQKIPNTTGNKSPYTYLLVHKILWHSLNCKTGKIP